MSILSLIETQKASVKNPLDTVTYALLYSEGKKDPTEVGSIP